MKTGIVLIVFLIRATLGVAEVFADDCPGLRNIQLYANSSAPHRISSQEKAPKKSGAF